MKRSWKQCAQSAFTLIQLTSARAPSANSRREKWQQNVSSSSSSSSSSFSSANESKGIICCARPTHLNLPRRRRRGTKVAAAPHAPSHRRATWRQIKVPRLSGCGVGRVVSGSPLSPPRQPLFISSCAAQNAKEEEEEEQEEGDEVDDVGGGGCWRMETSRVWSFLNAAKIQRALWIVTSTPSLKEAGFTGNTGIRKVNPPPSPLMHFFLLILQQKNTL